MKFKQYEIWIADLNPRFGTEPGKTRPVLVVQSDLLNKFHPSTIICPITTNVIEGTSILRINLTEGQSGLKKRSAIMIDQIRTIDNRRFLRKIGELPESIVVRVKENVKIVLELM